MFKQKRPPLEAVDLFYTSSLTNRSVVYRNLRVLDNWLELLVVQRFVQLVRRAIREQARTP